MITLQIIFFIAITGIFHSYLLYPVLLKLISKNKNLKYNKFRFDDDFPSVSVIMAAYNEDLVIEEKINSILSNKYPKNKLDIYIGSDNSTDNTNNLCKSFSDKHKNIHFFNFTERQGKIKIVNQLQKKADSDILILTDANVIFYNNTIFELIKYFKDNSIGLVDSRIINTGLKKEGISIQEKTYISREALIKQHESILWGTMMGPFGGCYAIRNDLYMDVPENYLVDDFFICMNILKQNKKCINNLEAKVTEDVSNNISDEFKRKIRIASGDYQNLWHFRSMLFPPWKPVAFCFLSHKALRWLGPFFIIMIILSLAFLMWHYQFYLILALLAVFVFIIPLFDNFLKKINIHNVILRFVTHFLTMNLALLVGFFKTLKGVKSNVWKPTKRHQ
jgi:cellulose synthase/poly-beta-1,6-N-acetylglucosamine synthase-like glycosyltransferase